MTTHPIDTEALRRLADAATAGPWENARNGVQQSLDAATKAGDYRYEGVGIVPEEYVRQDDAEFIAAARTAVPALLDALAAAEHRATRAEARIRHLEATAQITVRKALRAERERDEWRQAALDERGAALDALEQIKARDKRIQAVQHLVDQADHAGDWTVTCTHLQRALDGLIEHADLLARCAETDAARGIGQAVAGFAEGRRDTHYPIPEETP